MWYQIRRMSFEEYSKLYPEKGSDSFAESYVLTDPLSEVARRERKMLLGTAIFGILIAHAKLVPTKITALGIELTLAHQKSIISLIALLIGYFLAAFLIYGTSDLFTWWASIKRAVIVSLDARRTPKERVDFDKPKPRNEYLREQEQLQKVIDVEKKSLGKAARFFVPLTLTRAFFDFIVPVSVSIYGIIALLSIK